MTWQEKETGPGPELLQQEIGNPGIFVPIVWKTRNYMRLTFLVNPCRIKLTAFEQTFLGPVTQSRINTKLLFWLVYFCMCMFVSKLKKILLLIQARFLRKSMFSIFINKLLERLLWRFWDEAIRHATWCGLVLHREA